MIDICVVTWNARKRIEEFINSFLQRVSDVECRYIIVNNCSEDDTSDYLRELVLSSEYEIYVINSDERLTVPAAFNLALDIFRKGDNEYAFICHNDVLYGEGIDGKDPLELLIDGFAVHDDYVAISPLSDRIQQHLKKSGDLEDSVRETFQVLASSMMVNRKAMEIGLFDPKYNFFFFDMDYSRQIIEHGFKVAVHNGVFFPHPVPEKDDVIQIATFGDETASNLLELDMQYYNSKWIVVPSDIIPAEIGSPVLVASGDEEYILTGKIIDMTKKRVFDGIFRLRGTFEKMGIE